MTKIIDQRDAELWKSQKNTEQTRDKVEKVPVFSDRRG